MAIAKKKAVKKKSVKKRPVKKKVVKRKVAPKAGKGRPTRYKSEYINQAKVACRLGATDKDLAEMFGVTQRTINAWKKAHPKDFLHTIKEAKRPANEQVEQSLLQRACGYSHPDIDIRVINNRIVKTKLIKHYPPDTAAAFIWLKNRDPERWKDKQEGESNDTDLAEAFMKLAQVLPR